MSDLTLLRRMRDGQDDAATALYLRYAKRLHSLAHKQSSAAVSRRVGPEEIVQSVFRTFFRRVKKGDYDIPAGDELWRLLLVITLNKIRRTAIFHKAQRRDVRRTTSSDGLGIEQYVAQETCQSDTALTILRIVIADLIGQLPESKAEMIRMRIDGHEVDEIAATTQRSKRTVERTLQEFRQRLSQSLDEESEDETGGPPDHA
ncbi:MAG: helix-turn-helix domain-containing protein [Planctomycetes bacterium]|nr:helix-turn-helix domain-containing protein [Planctomycetota bacterium]